MTPQLNIIFNILIIVYIISINLYGFVLIKTQKKQFCPQPSKQKKKKQEEVLEDNAENDKEDSKSETLCIHKEEVRDIKLYLTGFLGGGLGIYVSMFIFKFRLTNLGLMVVMPCFIALNVYLVVLAFRSGFWAI